jgi:hypothetical protein
MTIDIARRKFIAALGGTAIAWPLAAHAQRPVLPVVGFVFGGSADASAPYVAAFRKGLNETGLRRRPKRDGRVPLAGEPIRSPAGAPVTVRLSLPAGSRSDSAPILRPFTRGWIRVIF